MIIKNIIKMSKVKLQIYKPDVELLTKDEVNKLKGYTMIDFNSLQVGDHFRYSANKYVSSGDTLQSSLSSENNEGGRKLAYAIVKKKGPCNGVASNENSIFVNWFFPYGINKYPDWKIDPTNKYKKYIFYKRIA